MKTTIKRKMRQEIELGRPLVRGELTQRGFRGNTLSELAARGRLYRVAHGVYAPRDGATSEWFDYELASKVVPHGVFTLFSALRLHGLTDENPQRMTMAISTNAHPIKSRLPLDFTYMKPELLSRDVVERESNGTSIRVFSVERTLAECFKHRNQIGIDVAVAALHEAAGKGLVDFSRFGQILIVCRMLRVVQPYLQGMV